jgi:diacylglycerol kinase (ATP)
LPGLDAKRVLISLNPRAGARARHAHVDEIEQALVAGGYEVQVTTHLAQLAEWAATGWQEGRVRAVVSVGGDGTASVVRSHVPLEVPLLPLPLGTENLLARYLAQKPDPAAVRQTLDDGVTIELDLGKAEGGQAGGRLFLLMISAGFDAEVIRRLHADRTGNITRVSYFLPTLRTIRDYEYPELQLYCGNDAASRGAAMKCRWIFGFNLPLYAVGLPIAPQATATDGLLDVCTFERGNLWGMLRYLWHVWWRRHGTLSDVALTRSGRFRLEAAGRTDVAYQLDGDFAGTLPVDVEVLPGQLRLFVSRATAGRLGFALPEETAAVSQTAGGVAR